MRALHLIRQNIAHPSARKLRVVGQSKASRGGSHTASDLQRQAWQWALANRSTSGALPSGEEVAAAHGRKERWGRLVKSAGQAGVFGQDTAQGLRRLADGSRDVSR